LKLLGKFNLLLIFVFGIGLALIAWKARDFLRQDARQQVLRQAELMAASATATRNYTANDIGPLLDKEEQHATLFLPETIPFYAATTTFNDLRKHYPDYTYKEAALNPTNLRDRPADWETDLIDYFRNTPSKTELIGERDTPTGRSLYLAHPISAAQDCLQCHGDPVSAPRPLLRRYGKDHGFGWHPGDVIGAQIISVPESVPIEIADKGFRNLLITLSSIFLATIILIDIGLYFIVIRPLRRISRSADRISTGEIELPMLRVHGRDELAQVTTSFNRMHTSLKKAFEMLNEE
jgi:HAMP domain-containing protein